MIDGLIEAALKKITALEKVLYAKIIEFYIDNFEIKDSKVSFSAQNLKVVNSNFDFEEVNKELKKLINQVIAGVAIAISKLGDDFDFDARGIEVSKQVIETLEKHSIKAVAQNASLDLVYADVKQQTISLMSKYEGISLKELRLALEDKIVQNGLVKRYWSRWTYDIYSQYERVGANLVRQKLGLSYAIYEGGKMDDTRPWCEKYNGKVLHIDDIKKWSEKDWQGKTKIGYDPFIDCGGYNCRHRWRWISDELAKRLIKSKNK